MMNNTGGNMTTSNTYCILDWETQDPDIDSRSWPCHECIPLGAAIITSDGKYHIYETNTDRVKEIVSKYDTIICHNAQYDVGILLMLGHDIYKHTIIDTKILAKLYKSDEDSARLDYLAEKYLNEKKECPELIALAHDLKERGLIKFTKSQNPLNILYKNMHIAQEYAFEIVESYALKDAAITENLYKFYIDKVDNDLNYYSDLLKCLIKSRYAGVPVSEANIEAVDAELLAGYEKYKQEAYNIVGREFNLNASDDFYSVIAGLGIRVPKKRDTGNYTITKDWMAKHPHPVFKAILKAKMYDKTRRDYVNKIKKYIKDGRIHPNFNPLGADTGRFTCNSPNIQQISARNPETLCCRSIFAAPPGKQWVSIDYSGQELRVALHFGIKAGAPGSDILQQEYIKDPNLDLHQVVADMCSISRSQAKGITLGIMYGMGKAKLAKQLEIDEDEAVAVRTKYNNNVPYLKHLTRAVEQRVMNRGYVISLDKRKIQVEQDLAYKGLNYLIQGSSAGQTMTAMVECYRQGIDILFSVHDEINFLVNESDTETIDKVKRIMETVFILEVPVVASVKYGKTWAECK